MDKNSIPAGTRELDFLDLTAKIMGQLLRDKVWLERLRDSLFCKQGVSFAVGHISGVVGLMGDQFGSVGIDEDDVLAMRLNHDVERAGFWVFFRYPRKPASIEVPSPTGLKLQFHLPRLTPNHLGREVNDHDRMFILKTLSELLPEKPDNQMSAVELEYKYLERNGGYHPTFRVEHWEGAVAGNFTRSGYWEWVEEQFRMFDETMDPLFLPTRSE